MFFPFLAIPFHIEYEADWARGLSAGPRRCAKRVADVFATRAPWFSQKRGYDSCMPLCWRLLVFASRPRQALPQREKFSFVKFLALDQPFEIAEVFFDSSQQTWGIENRADFQRYFRFSLKTRFERNHP